MDRLKTLWSHLSFQGEEFQKWDQKFSKNLKGQTVLITGASRGIGKAMAVRCGQEGANVVILAKTDKPHPKLPGTIYTARDEVLAVGGKCLALRCDIRSEDSVRHALEVAAAHFGGIDIVINNASSLNLVQTEEVTMKRWDLMNQVNSRGTFMTSKLALPYLKKSKNPHILIICPPPNMQPYWFGNHLPYSMAKYGMTMTCLGLSHELLDKGIAVNGLWPLTTIATAAVNNVLGGSDMMNRSRNPFIMSDAMMHILTAKSDTLTGNFFVDEDVIRSTGVTDL